MAKVAEPLSTATISGLHESTVPSPVGGRKSKTRIPLIPNGL